MAGSEIVAKKALTSACTTLELHPFLRDHHEYQDQPSSSSLHDQEDNGLPQHASAKRGSVRSRTLPSLGLLYGTATGSFGVLEYTQGKFKTMWKTATTVTSSSSSSSAITALVSFDLNQDDANEVIVRLSMSIYIYTIE